MITEKEYKKVKALEAEHRELGDYADKFYNRRYRTGLVEASSLYPHSIQSTCKYTSRFDNIAKELVEKQSQETYNWLLAKIKAIEEEISKYVE